MRLAMTGMDFCQLNKVVLIGRGSNEWLEARPRMVPQQSPLLGEVGADFLRPFPDFIFDFRHREFPGLVWAGQRSISAAGLHSAPVESLLPILFSPGSSETVMLNLWIQIIM